MVEVQERLNTEKADLLFEKLLRKNFQPNYEVIVYKAFDDIDYIWFIKSADICPKKYYKLLMGGKDKAGQNRFQVLAINLKEMHLPSQCYGYSKNITVTSYAPLSQAQVKEFNWSKERSYKVCGISCREKIMSRYMMDRIIKHIKSVLPCA